MTEMSDLRYLKPRLNRLYQAIHENGNGFEPTIHPSCLRFIIEQNQGIHH